MKQDLSKKVFMEVLNYYDKLKELEIRVDNKIARVAGYKPPFVKPTFMDAKWLI